MNAAEREKLLARIRELEARVEDYHHLTRILKRVHGKQRIREVLRCIVEEALHLCDADQGVILLLGPESSQEGQTVVREGGSAEQKLDHFLNTTLAGWVTRRKTALRTDRLQETFGKPFQDARYREIASVLSVPLLLEGRVMGVINLISLRPERRFGEREEHLLALLGEQCVYFIGNARTQEQLYEETLRLRKEVEHRYARHGLIGKSPAMRKVFSLLDKIIPTDARVLLEGESGTGKERIARAIHYSGPRRDKPFVAVDCGALPANLLESELFGYVKGAFTGATHDRKGLFEEADGGTLFLDEIVNMPPDIQAKFLRVIQEGEFRPLGTSVPRRVDVRIIAAASENLREKVAQGKFREDLFFRLNVVSLRIPPLRERREDIVLLANHFLQVMNDRYGKRLEGFSPDTLTLMENYPWPGNVRELEHLIERLVILAEPDLRIIPADYLPEEFHSRRKERYPASGASASTDLSIREKKAAYEKEMLIAALEKHGWNQSAAARELGITEKAVRYKMQKFGITKP